MKLLCEGPVNLYLLCTVVSKKARRLGRLMPEERIAELITIALRNCADHEFEIQWEGRVPELIREEAARIFPPVSLPRAVPDSSPDQSDRRQSGNTVSASDGQQATEGSQTQGEPDMEEPTTGIHVSVGTDVGSCDSCRNLSGSQGEHSMSNSNGTDRTHLRQLRAFAENLYLLASRHRERQSYVVAHALYGRALEAAQRTDNAEHSENGRALVTRIQGDQQAVYELLCRELGSPKRAQLAIAPKVGQ
jgi:hypothetical protein